MVYITTTLNERKNTKGRKKKKTQKDKVQNKRVKETFTEWRRERGISLKGSDYYCCVFRPAFWG